MFLKCRPLTKLPLFYTRRKLRPPVVWLGSLVVSVSDPMTARSEVRSLTTALSSNNLGQVIHTPQPVGAMPQFGGPAD